MTWNTPPRRCLPQGHKLSEDTQQHNAPFLHQGCEKETQGERNFDCALRLGNVSGLCAHISVFFLSYGNLYPFFSLCCLWIPWQLYIVVKHTHMCTYTDKCRRGYFLLYFACLNCDPFIWNCRGYCNFRPFFVSTQLVGGWVSRPQAPERLRAGIILLFRNASRPHKLGERTAFDSSPGRGRKCPRKRPPPQALSLNWRKSCEHIFPPYFRFLWNVHVHLIPMKMLSGIRGFF